MLDVVSRVDEVNGQAILEAFTPIDRSVYASLPPKVREHHLMDLVRRIANAAELAAPSQGAAMVEQALAQNTDPDDLIRDLDAALEYGREWHELDDSEQQQTLCGEIRQEIQHFDRIMDLESIKEGRWLKGRRDFVTNAGPLGAVERLLVLVNERRTLRGRGSGEWIDLGAEPQRHLSTLPHGSVLRRTQPPFVMAVVQADDRYTERSILELLEKYCLKHPVGVALALVDYEAFLTGLPPCALAVAAFLPTGHATRVSIWSAANASWIALRRRGFEFDALTVGNVAGQDLGLPMPRFANHQIELEDVTDIAIALDDGELSRAADPAAIVNRRNRSRRVVLAENLIHYTSSRACGVQSKVDRLAVEQSPKEASEDDFAEAFCRELIAEAQSISVAIECGHVHSDRDVGPAQHRGLKLGAEVLESLEATAHLHGVTVSRRVTPMVDDDHVLNRLSYSGYRQLFSEAGIPVDELIMESSPIIRAIAHDIIRRALALREATFKLESIGHNLYLSVPGMRVELMEDMDGSARNGCVLFEVALIMYRAAPTQLTQVFWDEVGRPGFDVHWSMESQYETSRDPVARERVRCEFDELFVDPWERIVDTADDTPFLAAYDARLRDARASGEEIVVLNVLEDYYKPQQVKVLQLAKLLGVDLPLHAIFFSPHGSGLSRLAKTSG